VVVTVTVIHALQKRCLPST